MAAHGIPPGEGALLATFQTSIGNIVVRLYEREAPLTVQTFAGLATGAREWRDPHTGQKQQGVPLYDGTTFHRVVPNFMVQGGDPYTRHPDADPAKIGTGDPGFRLVDEVKNALRFDRPGLLAMANSNRPNTNGSQFFLTEVAVPHLTGRHTIFGEVVKGFELIPKIARVAAAGDRAIQPVQLHKVTITRAGA